MNAHTETHKEVLRTLDMLELLVEQAEDYRKAVGGIHSDYESFISDAVHDFELFAAQYVIDVLEGKEVHVLANWSDASSSVSRSYLKAGFDISFGDIDINTHVSFADATPEALCALHRECVEQSGVAA